MSIRYDTLVLTCKLYENKDWVLFEAAKYGCTLFNSQKHE